jgi:Zn-dependent protease with chaperone function
VVYLDRPGPALYCAGVRRPAVYVSRGALALLDDGELHAALAHEAAHAERKDPERSWVVMGLRAVMCLNPTFQILARTLARDAERLADERGAELGADRLALASGLIKLHRSTGGGGRRTLVFGGALAGPFRRARSLDVELRARALLAPAPARLPFGRLRLALAGASALGMLYFVV